MWTRVPLPYDGESIRKPLLECMLRLLISLQNWDGQYGLFPAGAPQRNNDNSAAAADPPRHPTVALT